MSVKLEEMFNEIQQKGINSAKTGTLSGALTVSGNITSTGTNTFSGLNTFSGGIVPHL